MCNRAKCSGEKNIRSPADFACLPTDKKMISLILMVGLFEQWETEKQKNPEKRI